MDANSYFNALQGDRRESLTMLRKMIKEILPGAIEDMSYKLPTYSKEGYKICAVANQKHYMALYIMNYDLLSEFNEELKNYNCGKSCIRFKNLDSKSLTLFKEILVYVSENITESRFYKK